MSFSKIWYSFISFFKNFFKKEEKEPTNINPEESEESPSPSEDSKPIRIEVIYRDGIGITGACKKAKKINPDYIMECHFNSYNGEAGGFLVLSNNHSKQFAQKFLSYMRREYPNKRSRGIDTNPNRGGKNISACSGDHYNILIEPFFGDNPKDCIDHSEMVQILIDFISQFSGTFVLIVGHTKASPGAYSQTFKEYEYTYWKNVCTTVKNYFDHHQNDQTEEEQDEVTREEQTKIIKGWRKQYEELIRQELATSKYFYLNSFANPDYWIAFFHALAKAESNCDPFSTYWERKLGNPKGYDPVTKMKYLSEGLFQLSYSDAIYYKCNFDIESDREKDSDDKTKTIFKPCNNIKCALVIMNKLMSRHKSPFFNNGHYWAVLKPNNPRHKVFLRYFTQYQTK